MDWPPAHGEGEREGKKERDGGVEDGCGIECSAAHAAHQRPAGSGRCGVRLLASCSMPGGAGCADRWRQLAARSQERASLRSAIDRQHCSQCVPRYSRVCRRAGGTRRIGLARLYRSARCADIALPGWRRSWTSETLAATSDRCRRNQQRQRALALEVPSANGGRGRKDQAAHARVRRRAKRPAG